MIIVEVQDQNIAIGEEAAAEPYCQVVIQLPRSELDPILLSLAAREPVAADLQALGFFDLLRDLQSRLG